MAVGNLTSDFRTRIEAGRILAGELADLKLESPLIMAIPRGGLPVAQEVAARLGADLDIAPGPESAVAESTEFAAVTADQILASSGYDPSGRDVVIVEDGIATGAHALAAAKSTLKRGARRVVIATPVVGVSAIRRITDEGFELVVLKIVEHFDSLTRYYEDLEPVSDLEVHEVREAAKKKTPAPVRGEASERIVEVPMSGDSFLKARLFLPEKAVGSVVMFQDRELPIADLAQDLQEFGYAVLSCDIEAVQGNVNTRANVIRGIIQWTSTVAEIASLPSGLIASGASAAAGIEAAASVPELIRAVISIDGELDLEAGFLERLQAPILFVVDSDEQDRVRDSRAAMEKIVGEKSLVTVSGRGRRFEGEAALAEALAAVHAFLARHLQDIVPVRGVSPLTQGPALQS